MPFTTTNPATGEVEKTFPEHSPAEVEARLARAAATFAAFRRTSFAERARLMTTAAELLEGEMPDVARMLTTEMGKTFAAAKGEVAKCAMALRWFAEHAEAPAGRRGDRDVGQSQPRPLPAARDRCWPSCPGTSPSGRWSASPPRPSWSATSGLLKHAVERAADGATAGGPVPAGRVPRGCLHHPADRFGCGGRRHRRRPGGGRHPDRQRAGRPVGGARRPARP